MKTWKISSALLILFLFFGLSFSCSKDNEKDPCDDTVKPEIAVNIKATVHVLTKDNEPIPNQELNFWIYKEPCGAPIKGEFSFAGLTNEQGIRQSTLVGYNLRNSEDKVWVDAHAVNLGNGSADADSELVSYKYGDFIVGTTKEVHVYIYRNF
ncbi:MAG: hypothetical protein KDC05_14035 [Bacteroidales bacterium]|nr:hypothetical protein [Bacteroidales bacterium]